MNIFQVLPSIVRDFGAGPEIDIDFTEALNAYLHEFETVTVACPISRSTNDFALARTVPIKELSWGDRFRFLPLPNAYRLPDYLRHFLATRAILKKEILQSDCVIVSPHTLIGDWPTVAAFEARRDGKPYVIEADVVYESLSRLAPARKAAWKIAVNRYALQPVFTKLYRKSLRHSAVGLFQGSDVFDAYADSCPRPYKLQHHIPINKGDHIDEATLRTKIDDVKKGTPLRICYVGRATAMKGPFDWISVIHELLLSHVNLTATWLGDGDLLPNMKRLALERGIADRVKFPGYISDRKQVLDTMRQSHIFLFCHKTRESARCLGEALACGCPIVGYESAYAADLVKDRGGGLFAGQNDWGGIADELQRLDADRDQLANLITDAATSGRLFDRAAMLRQRMALIRQHMPTFPRVAF